MTQSFDLAWIVVKDLKKAVKFYTEIVGLKLNSVHEEFGWAELEGPKGGARLGIAQENDQDPIKAGGNACLTFTVENLEESRDSFLKKGAKFLGEILEIPGHVKLLSGVDTDGNHFQLAQKLSD